MRTAGVRTCRTALSGPVRSVLTVVGLALLVLIGRNVFQTTDQVNADGSGTGLKKYRVNGIGAEFGYRTESRWAFITRWYLEYAARNRPEGTTIRFVVLKNF